MVSRMLPCAWATHCRPFEPSTTAPSSARKPRAAFKLGRLVPCPHDDRWRSSSLRLIGPRTVRKTARMYSMVSSVGLAPGRANAGLGGASSIGTGHYGPRGYVCVSARVGHVEVFHMIKGQGDLSGYAVSRVRKTGSDSTIGDEAPVMFAQDCQLAGLAVDRGEVHRTECLGPG